MANQIRIPWKVPGVATGLLANVNESRSLKKVRGISWRKEHAIVSHVRPTFNVRIKKSSGRRIILDVAHRDQAARPQDSECLIKKALLVLLMMQASKAGNSINRFSRQPQIRQRTMNALIFAWQTTEELNRVLNADDPTVPPQKLPDAIRHIAATRSNIADRHCRPQIQEIKQYPALFYPRTRKFFHGIIKLMHSLFAVSRGAQIE